MLNNPNEWHNIESEEELLQQPEVAEEAPAPSLPFSLDKNQLIKIGAGVLIIVVLLVVAISKKVSSNKSALKEQPGQEELGEYFYDQAGGQPSDPNATVVVDVEGDTPADQNPSVATTAGGVAVPTPVGGNPDELMVQSLPIQSKTMNAKTPDKDTVLVSIGGGGRENPFLPYKEKKVVSGNYDNLGFELVEPPSMSIPDPMAEELMQTTISGIMYDTRNPSAIVNINGEDQLVRRGDRLYGFSILDITRDKVVIKSGSNIYRASVGQSITNEGVNINEVANLQRKFGGRYNQRNVKPIQIRPN